MTRKMTVNKAKAQRGNVLFPAWECFVSSVGINNSPKAHFLRSLLLLLVMLTVGVGNVWGQAVDYSGTYYIGSSDTRGGNNISDIHYSIGTPANNYYLCPTDENNWIYYQDESPYFTETKNGQPFLTTYKYRAEGEDATEAQWIIIKVQNSDYYHKHHYSCDNGT